MMGITYGITVVDHDDQYINMAEKALEGAGQAASPGAFLVDLIPSREPPLSLQLWPSHLLVIQSQIRTVRIFLMLSAIIHTRNAQ